MTSHINTLEVLREAMDLERDGFKFYKKAAASSADRKTKEVFIRLAADEKNHLEKLELLYDNLSENEEWLVLQDLMQQETSKQLPEFDVFEDDIKDGQLDEKTALDIGIKAEQDSIDFYKKAMTECADERGCEIFKWLVDFEQDHLLALKQRKKAL